MISSGGLASVPCRVGGWGIDVGMAVGVGGGAAVVGGRGVMADETARVAVGDGKAAGDSVTPQPARSKARAAR